MKNIILGILKGVWFVVRLILGFVGVIGSYVFAFVLLVFLGGFAFLWIAFSWDHAADLLLLPTLAVLGMWVGCVIAQAIATFQPD